MKIPKTISLKTTLTIIALTTILIAGTFYALAVNPSSTFYIAGGKYPGGISYTVWREGTNYFAKNAYGQIHASSGTNISELTDNLIVATTYEILFTGGTYVFDSTVVVDYPIKIRGEGNQTILQLNANVNLFNVTSNNVRFYDFYADGNSKQGHGFYGDGVINCRWENLRIRAFQGRGISLSLPTGGNCWIIGNRITSCDYAIFLSAVSDCYIIGNDLGATIYNVLQLGGAHHLVEGNRVYMGGYNWSGDLSYHAYRGIDIYQSHYMTIVGNQIVSNGGSGILLNEANYTTIDGNYINENDRANDNRAGIRLYGDSSFNDIVGNTINNVGGSASQNYGIREESGDYNNIVGCNAWNQITVGILTTGSNTEVMSSWNGTTYIAGATGATGPAGPPGSGAQFGAYTFIIYQNSTNTEARNWLGTLCYSDSDDDSIFQDCIDDMDAWNDPGLIFVKNGTYSFDTTVGIDEEGITIQGESQQSVTFSWSGGTSNYLWQIESSYTELRDFSIDMNDVAGCSGIWIDDTSRNIIYNVEITEVAVDGIYLNASAEENSNRIEKCTIRQPGRAGVYIDENIGHTWVNDCVISDSTDAPKITDYGIYTTSDMKENKFTNNRIWGVMNGIYVDGTTAVIIQHNVMTDNDRCILLTSSNNDILISGNRFWYTNRYDTQAWDNRSDIVIDSATDQWAGVITDNQGHGESVARHFIWCSNTNILEQWVMDGNACINYADTEYDQGTQSGLTVGDNT